MKEEVIKAISRVSEEEFLEATGRWIGMGLNPAGMLENFVSILREYDYSDEGSDEVAPNTLKEQ